MSSGDDAFGHMLWAYHQNKESFEVTERDDGLLELGHGPERYFKNYENWSQAMKQAISFAQGKILDLGCGAGRHALYLQRKGHEVLGIDLSPLALKVCRQRGLERTKETDLRRIDQLEEEFDTVLLLGNNFGLMGAPERGKEFLDKLQQVTAENALIIAEELDPYQTEDPAHKQYQQQNKKEGKMPGHIKLRLRFRQYIGDWFDLLFLSSEELQDLIADTGWQLKELVEEKGSARYSFVLGKGGD